MTAATLDIDAIAPEAVPGVRLMAIVHERVDLAPLVRGVLDELRPAAVAVELPTTLADAVTRAVGRLPKISVVVSEEPAEEALVWVVTPGDPLVEGMRWAAANERPILLVDPDVRYRLRHRDPVPDPHAIWTIGAGQYLAAVRHLAGGADHDDSDTLRERGRAYHLTRAASSIKGPIVGLLGAAHADRVAALLAEPTAPPLARQMRQHVELRHLHPDSLTAVLDLHVLDHHRLLSTAFQLLQRKYPILEGANQA